MDDFFIAEYCDWKVRSNSYIDRFLNRVFGKIGLRYFPASFVLDGVDTAVTRIEGRRLSPLFYLFPKSIEDGSRILYLAVYQIRFVLHISTAICMSLFWLAWSMSIRSWQKELFA